MYKSKRRGRNKFSKRTARSVARRARFRKRNVVNKTTVSAGLGFPKKMLMTHRYFESTGLQSTAGLINKYQYSVNNLYDPNTTGGGHQPYYFDQMAALYDHYTVIASRVKFTIEPYATNTTHCYVGVYMDDDTTTTNINDISVLAETSKRDFRIVSLRSAKPVCLYSKWSAKKAFGGSILSNNSLQGTSAASPTEQQYFTIAVQGFAGTNASVSITAQIEYIAVWAELKEVAQS